MHINSKSLRPTPTIAFIIIAIAIGWVGATASNRDIPVGPAKIIVEEPEKITPGGYLLIDVIVPYYQSCATTVKRVLYDTNNVHHVLPEMRLPAGEIGLQHSASRFPLPKGFAVGPAKYRSQVSYTCNWFQRWFWPITVPERKADFMVIPVKPGSILNNDSFNEDN